VTTLAPGLNAIYCISLQEQPHRTTKAAAQFHALGLCQEALFYRPVRGRDTDRAIWNSHRAVAQDAIAKGFTRILVLEDDVLFTQPRETLVRRITAALRALPSTWWGLYLGHVPIQAYFLRANLLRVRSGCTHAYIANAPLLAWLASTPPKSPEARMWHWIGQSIDAAMSSLPEMYAMFPMIAVQRYLGEASAGTRLDDQRQPGHIPRGWALLLHLWCGSTLCRSRGHTIFASALADSRMGAPTRRRSHSLHCNGRECLEHPPRIGALPPLAACPLYPRKRTSLP
jgi:hypothetical protein